MGSFPPTKHLRVAMLECDEPVGMMKEKYGSYGNMFKRLLEKGLNDVEDEQEGVQPQVELDVTNWDVVNTEHYPNLEDVDAVLLTGSKYNSFDNYPWILKLVEFTQKVLAQDRVRMIGVCFGHQIIGRALGTEVGRNEKGWEISVVPQQLTEKGKEIFGVEQLHLYQMHQDIVFNYPPTVDPLAHTPRCHVQAMYVKNHLISVQGHPEFNEEIVTAICEKRYAQGILYGELYEDAMTRVGKPHDGKVVAAAFVRFLLEQ